MNFRTEFKPTKAGFSLSPERPVTLLGSCFAGNIGAKMKCALWDARINPCGTLFNPLSIEKSILLAVKAASDDVSLYDDIANSIIHRDGLYFSWLTDTSVNAGLKQDLHLLVEGCLSQLANDIRDSQAVIITLGTAFIYSLAVDPNYVVANCHKFPERQFMRRRISLDEVADSLNRILDAIRKINNECRVIFTVSPVRHLRDGFVENNRSKATLSLAVDKLIATTSIDADYVAYFPAFEILNDDLRDYRFYASDLAHPSEEAINYIWQNFIDTFLSMHDADLIKEGENLFRRVNHRPLNTASLSFAKFSSETANLTEEFIQQHPGMLSPLE